MMINIQYLRKDEDTLLYVTKGILCMLVFVGSMTPAHGQPFKIRELPRTDIKGPAVSWYDEQGPVIYYNPLEINQLGPHIPEFIRAHEYGHHYLGHIDQTILLRSRLDQPNHEWQTFAMEKEADLYAVRIMVENGLDMAVLETIALFALSSRQSLAHPDPKERANYIRAYYEKLKSQKNGALK